MIFLKELLIISLIVLFIVVLSNLFDLRVCLLYNLFRIPCPGCGGTRALELLIQGKVHKSVEYNIIPIIMIILGFFLSVWSLIDYKTKRKTLKTFLEKNKMFLIIISIIFTIVIWIINIKNPLLY